MTRANFTDQGLPIGQNDVNMTYMYGLSDFFTVMFEDPSTVNLLLEAGTQGSAEIYSNFLQLTSSLSLQGICDTMGTSLKLVLLNSTAAVQGSVNKYTLQDTLLSSRYIANRPFLPTTTLEENIDFRLETDPAGNTTVTFAQSLDKYAFSIRTLADGSKQYALWFVDAAIDERMISTYYGQLIGADPQNSTDAFHNFIYGLYYVYVQGPTLDVMRKGLNLTLGLPLARGTETVLDIRNYLDTDQYIVITDANQYLIPYGLPPSVSIGQVVKTGDELAKWVEIKDYIHDGEWWLNLQIPPSIIPSLPDGQKDRYATEGSHFDYLMRNYLKKHTFLVNINVSNFENIQTYQQLSDIIRRAKPTYTQPIYIWTVSSLKETIHLDDEKGFLSRVDPSRCENIGLPIERFHRNNSENPTIRHCAQFMRFNVPNWVSKICGTDEYVNGDPESMSMMGNLVDGFTNYVHQYRANTPEEVAWMRAVLARGSETWWGRQSKVGFRIDSVPPAGENGVPVYLAPQAWETPVGSKVVPLYITTDYDIVNKTTALGLPAPAKEAWHFPLFGANQGSRAINAIAINDAPINNSGIILREHYNALCFRTDGIGYLGLAIPDVGWRTYAPAVNEILDTDYLLGIRITDNTVGVYWVTRNTLAETPPYFVITEIDPLKVTYDMPLTRYGGLNGTPYYLLRGRGVLDYNNVNTAINTWAINGEMSNSPTLDQTYVDKYNPVRSTIDRSGHRLVHAIEAL